MTIEEMQKRADELLRDLGALGPRENLQKALEVRDIVARLVKINARKTEWLAQALEEFVL